MPVPSYTGAAYGWRARIGMLQPSQVAEVNAHEFYLMAPDGVQIAITSLGMVERAARAPDAAERALDNVERPIRLLLGRKVDVIVQIGIPLVTRNGRGFEQTLRERVAKVTDVPFAMDIRCSIDALQALGVARIGLLGTFDDAALTQVAAYIKEDGIAVVAQRSIRDVSGDDQGTVPLSLTYREAKALFAADRSMEAIWIPGASLPTVGAIQAMEDDFGIPVVSSASAMMWEGLRLVGINPSQVTRCGRLFQA